MFHRLFIPSKIEWNPARKKELRLLPFAGQRKKTNRNNNGRKFCPFKKLYHTVKQATRRWFFFCIWGQLFVFGFVVFLLLGNLILFKLIQSQIQFTCFFSIFVKKSLHISDLIHLFAVWIKKRNRFINRMIWKKSRLKKNEWNKSGIKSKRFANHVIKYMRVFSNEFRIYFELNGLNIIHISRSSTPHCRM